MTEPLSMFEIFQVVMGVVGVIGGVLGAVGAVVTYVSERARIQDDRIHEERIKALEAKFAREQLEHEHLIERRAEAIADVYKRLRSVERNLRVQMISAVPGASRVLYEGKEMTPTEWDAAREAEFKPLFKEAVEFRNRAEDAAIYFEPDVAEHFDLVARDIGILLSLSRIRPSTPDGERVYRGGIENLQRSVADLRVRIERQFRQLLGVRTEATTAVVQRDETAGLSKTA